MKFITFKEWVFQKTISEVEIDQTVIDLHHGTLLEDARSILQNGIQSQSDVYGVSEFWATTNKENAKIFAQVHSKFDAENPQPLGIYSFSIPKRILEEMKNHGLAQEEEPGVYQFFENSFEYLNEYSIKKRIEEIETSDLLSNQF